MFGTARRLRSTPARVFFAKPSTGPQYTRYVSISATMDVCSSVSWLARQMRTKKNTHTHTHTHAHTLTLGRVWRVHVYVLTLGAEELDCLHVRLISHPERHHRLPSAQKVWTVAELLKSMHKIWGPSGGSSWAFGAGELRMDWRFSWTPFGPPGTYGKRGADTWLDQDSGVSQTPGSCPTSSRNTTTTPWCQPHRAENCTWRVYLAYMASRPAVVSTYRAWMSPYNAQVASISSWLASVWAVTLRHRQSHVMHDSRVADAKTEFREECEKIST